MDVVLESEFSVQSLRDYVEKIEICDIILEDVTEEMFEEFMKFMESHKILPEGINKDEDEVLCLYFQILSSLLKFNTDYARSVNKDIPNFVKKSTTEFLPIERKKPAHPHLLSCMITLLSIPSLKREDIHIRNQIFLSRCSYNLLYHVADIRMNIVLIHAIVLVSVRLGHEELDRSVQHPFFKNFFSFFLSQIHTTSDFLSDRLLYLGMFFNSSKYVKKFCVVGDGRRIVECLMNIIKMEFEKKKEFFVVGNRLGPISTIDDEEETKKQLELVELTMTTLVDILESPACPYQELREEETGLGFQVKDVFVKMSKDKSLHTIIRDGSQLILEVLEENCASDDLMYQSDDDDDDDDQVEKTEEELEYERLWLLEFEKLNEERREKERIAAEQKRREISKEDAKKHEEVREKEEEELKEQDLIHNTERDFRRTAYIERLGKRAEKDWMDEVNEREAWVKEVRSREARVEASKERLILERNRLRKTLIALQMDLKIFGEQMKDEARERLQARYEEEAKLHREARIRELNSSNHGLGVLTDLRSMMGDRRDIGFEEVPTPQTPLSPGGAFSRAHLRHYAMMGKGQGREDYEEEEEEEEEEEQGGGGMFFNYRAQGSKKKTKTKKNKNEKKSKKLKRTGSLFSRNKKKKNKEPKKKNKKKGIQPTELGVDGQTQDGKDDEKCSIM